MCWNIMEPESSMVSMMLGLAPPPSRLSSGFCDGACANTAVAEHRLREVNSVSTIPKAGLKGDFDIRHLIVNPTRWWTATKPPIPPW